MSGRLRIAFYGGVEGEVGGNQILLRHEAGDILLDIGCNFSLWRKYFDFPLLVPKEPADYFKVGLVHEDLRQPGSDHLREGISAVFISHAHTDHYDAMCTLRPGGARIYMGETTYSLVKARYARARRSPLVERVRALLAEDVEAFRTGARVEVGDVSIMPWHVDHSVPGAYAFLIDTPEGLVIYTGDFRLHGSYSEKLRSSGEPQFWEKALEVCQGERVKALICEGTNIGETANPLTENDVASLLSRCMEACEGLVIVNTSTYDVDRLRTIRDSASRVGRTLVAPESFMYALRALEEDVKLKGIPEVGKDVLCYSEVKEELKRCQERFVLLTCFFREKEIIEVEPRPGSYFILSSSEPFEEESEVAFERLKNWLERFGVPIYHIHASGHAHPVDIRQVVRELEPELVIPIHTARPYAFARFVADIVEKSGGEVVIPKKGQEVELGR